MIIIVSHVEVNNLLPLITILLHIRQLQTPVLHTVVTLHNLLTTIHNPRRITTVAVHHRKINHLTLLPTLRIKRTSTDKHIQHVIHTITITLLQPRVTAVRLLPVLTTNCLTVSIIIKHLVNIITLALPGTLTVIQRSHIQTAVAQQRVTQHKHVVNTLAATSRQTRTPSTPTTVAALHSRHRSCAGLHPHKLPVIIQVIRQIFTRLESSVAKRTLTLRCRHPHKQQQQHANNLFFHRFVSSLNDDEY